MDTNTHHAKQLPVYTDPYDIGNAFEQYVINLFNKDHFLLLDWQFAKRRKEVSHLDLNFPDLYMVFGRKKQYRFAVECKYLSHSQEGLIRWAKESNIKSYSLYQRRFAIPVFIAIGIGGHPSAPEKLFVTPFENLADKTEVYEHELYLYKRKPTHRFFYDTIQLRLF